MSSKDTFTLDEFLKNHKSCLEGLMKEGESLGPWRFDPDDLTIEHRGTGYWIRLSECVDSAHTLDWIAQVSGKATYTDEEVGQLVRLMDKVLYMQGHLCGCGKDHKIDVKAVLANRLRMGI